MHNDATATRAAQEKPTGAPDSHVRCARLSERPDWAIYLASCDWARDSENAVRVQEGVDELYPMPARLPNFEGVE